MNLVTAIAHEEASRHPHAACDVYTFAEQAAQASLKRMLPRILPAVRLDVRRRLAQRMKRQRNEHRCEVWWNQVAAAPSFHELASRAIFECVEPDLQQLARQILFEGLSLRDYQAKVGYSANDRYRRVMQQLRSGFD